MCKRFEFQPSMIKFLKEMVTSSFMYSPTRVLVVTAWMHKHAVSAIGLNFRTTSFAMIVDLRKRMFPPLSEKCLGNMSVIADKEEMDLKDLVCKIKQGLSEFCDFYPKIFGGNNLSLISECLRQATDPNSKKKKCNWF